MPAMRVSPFRIDTAMCYGKDTFGSYDTSTASVPSVSDPWHSTNTPVDSPTSIKDRSYLGTKRPCQMWRPFVFRPLFSVLFGVFTFSLVAVLQILIHLSNSHDGFPAPSTTLYISVTYIPVALVVLVGWAWQVFDLEVKKLAPWVALGRGASTAKESILLDYVGANPFHVLVESVGRRHYRVTVTALGRWVAAGAIVSATSLWAVLPTSISRDVMLSYKGTFNASAFDSTILDPSFLYTFLGTQLYNVSSPPWIHEHQVFTPFDTEHAPINSIVTGPSVGYQADLSCRPVASVKEAGFVTVQDFYNLTGRMFGSLNLPLIEVSVDDCSAQFNVTTYMELGIHSNNRTAPLPFNGTTPYVFGRIQKMTCADLWHTVLVVTEYEGPRLMSSSALVCTPYLTQFAAQISVNTTTLSFSSPPSVSKSTEEAHFPDANGIFSWIESSVFAYVGRQAAMKNDPLDSWYTMDPAIYPPDVETLYDPWFWMLTHIQQLPPSALLDPSKLMLANRQLFSSLWPHITQSQKLFTGETFQFGGSTTHVVQRLVCRTMQLQTLQASIVFMGAAVLLLAFTHPSSGLRRDPGSLASMSIILAASPEADELFTQTGSLSEEELTKRLGDWLFYTETTHDNRVELRLQKDVETKLSSGSSSVKHKEVHSDLEGLASWRPAILRPAAQIGIVTVFISLAIIIEVLFQVGNRSKGLFDVPSSFLARYSWLYSFPFILFLLGLVLETFDSAVRAVDLLTAFSHSPQPADRFITYTPLGHTAATFIIHAFQHQRFGPLASTMATFVMPFAKIVVAGLLIPQTITIVTHQPMKVNSTFDGNLPIIPPSYVNNGIISLTSDDFGHVGPVVLLQTLPQFNSRPPALTTTEYAVGGFDTSDLSGTGSFRVRLPVIYPDVSCFVVDPSEYSLEREPLGHKRTVLEKRVRTLSRVWSVGTVPSSPGYFSIMGHGVTTLDAFSVLFGKTKTNTSLYENSYAIDLIEEIYYLDCIPTMYQLTMEVDFDLDNGSPVIAGVDNSTELDRVETAFFNPTDYPRAQESVVPWAKFWFMEVDLPTIINASDVTNDTWSPFVTFIRTVHPETPETYLDSDLFTSYIRSMFRAYWVQYASRNLRVSTPTEFTTTATVDQRMARVTVASIPARIMQSLLLVILALVLVASIASRRCKNIPKAPYSIAAQLSFLAGSKLCRLGCLQGSEAHCMSDSEVRTALKPFRLTLGWTTDVHGQYRFGVDFETAEEEIQRIQAKANSTSSDLSLRDI